MNSDVENDIITIAVEIKGIKAIKLLSQKNKLQVVIDKSPFKENFSKGLLDEFKIKISENPLL